MKGSQYNADIADILWFLKFMGKIRAENVGLLVLKAAMNTYSVTFISGSRERGSSETAKARNFRHHYKLTILLYGIFCLFGKTSPCTVSRRL